VQPQLAHIVHLLESTQDRLHRLVADVPETKWAVRPAPDRWSIAECVGHLNLTSQAVIPLARTAVAKAALLPPLAAGRSYRHSFLGAVLSAVMGPVFELGPLHLMRVRTVAPFVPNAAESCVSVMADFDRLQGELIALVAASDGRAIDRELVTSLFDPRVSYNLYSAFVMVARHELRHVVQAERAWRDVRT